MWRAHKGADRRAASGIDITALPVDAPANSEAFPVHSSREEITHSGTEMEQEEAMMDTLNTFRILQKVRRQALPAFPSLPSMRISVCVYVYVYVYVFVCGIGVCGVLARTVWSVDARGGRRG